MKVFVHRFPKQLCAILGHGFVCTTSVPADIGDVVDAFFDSLVVDKGGP
jgi:hypothetical protein